MFTQKSPNVCWMTFSKPKTLVNVGTDALALLCQNIVVFHDVKTKARTYFKGDNAQTTAGIALLAGHTLSPYFAVSEAVLRPSIYVLKYPEMEKLTVIPPDDHAEYVSLHMSEHGFLAALSGAPNYTLRLWNYRTGTHFADVETNKSCIRNSLYFTTSSEALLIQYSDWNKQILVWELCLTAEKYHMHELSTIQLGNDFEKSNLFHITYWEDGNAYVVNDFGTVMSINIGLFSLKSEWKVPNPQIEPKQYKLFHNKNGLLVVQNQKVYFIKRRQNDWIIEWKIDDTKVPIQKMVSDYNNNIYASTDLGNVYYVDHVGDAGILRDLYVSNFQIQDYCLLKNVKEEVILLLTSTGQLRLVDIARMNLISEMYVSNACGVTAHNTSPYIAVGTTKGEVYFMSYENRRAPQQLAVVQLDELAIINLRLYDNTALVHDKIDGLHLLHCDFKNNEFSNTMTLAPESQENWHITYLFLLDANRALTFITFDSDENAYYSTQAWLYWWLPNELFVHRREFHLPYKYRDFTVIMPTSQDMIEFIAVRADNFVFDVLILIKDKELNILYSIKTAHFGHINSISGSKNIISSSAQGIIYHFRTHKRLKNPYMIARPLLTTYVPRLRKRMDECFNSKYLLVLYVNGFMLVCQLPLLVDALRENEPNLDVENVSITARIEIIKEPKKIAEIFIPVVTEDDLKVKAELKEEIKVISKAVHDLINYDISVTGQSHGIFRKFCLNTKWLEILTEEARFLNEKEYTSLIESIDDQIRIRDWILNLIKYKSTAFSYQLRSIFSHTSFENYATHEALKEMLKKFDYFRFYNVDLMEDEIEQRKSIVEEMQAEEEDFFKRTLEHYVLESGRSVYEHVMAKDFEMQDIKTVSFYQMYNEDAKLQTIIIDALKNEFNKEFLAVKNSKEEIINFVLDTNAKLRDIYSNMNCMLCLLKLQQFTPPELSMPAWTNDENLEKILTVDDSEIVAVNRRRKKAEQTAYKSGRMLLWPLEYWTKAIMFMMDGVLEKLWEEEIKKTPQIPEFMLRKHPHEYTIEEQRFVLEYENNLKALDEDRQKYLRILKEKEVKTLQRKKHFIIKMNEKIAETAILKLKYDFAIKHERLRLLNIKVMNFKRIECRRRITAQRKQMDKLVAYIGKYGKLLDFWERSFNDVKTKLENQTYRDKQLERQFKSQFLNTIPAHLTHELNKIYKRRPKLQAKSFCTASVCFEVAERIVSRKQQKFPLPQELFEFLASIDALDELQNCPNQLDQKHWENFIKIRRQKLESELRLKGIGYQLLDAQNRMNFFTKELNTLKNTRTETTNILMDAMEDYFETAQNQTLEIVLEMGQIELNLNRSLDSFRNCILMHVDDINDVNELIRTAGQRKLNAMQRVAFFRRQVIYKEWEHKVVRANIEYLEYVMKLIKNCKVTHEFLDVLRNWDKQKDNKVSTSIVGSIEQTVERRIDTARKRLNGIYKQMDHLKFEIFMKKKENHKINRQIQEVKANVTFLNASRDRLSEEKLARQRNERLAKLKAHRDLIDTVRRDYIQIMELSTILELQRLRTYPTLGPAPQCIE